MPASGQVPATTGPDVIKDVTGSGRVAKDDADAEQGASESPADVAPASDAVRPDTGAADGVSETTATPATGPGDGASAPEAEASPVEASPARAPSGEPEDGGTAGQAAREETAPDVGVALQPVDAPSKPAFVVGSWAGAYGQAQRAAVIEPVARELDIAIERRVPGEGAQEADGLDVVEMSQERLLAACRAGRIIRISDWPDEDGAGVLDKAWEGDFLVAAGPDGCGVPSFAWSSILVANPSAMKALAKRHYREPGSIDSLVNVRRYPGKRALIREPRRLMEMLLLADGVGRGEVYEVLATRAGEDRAFELLEALKDNIEWVSGPRAAFAALDAGRVTMAMAFSGRAFRRLIAGDLRPIWDGHVIEYASWAVPKSTGRGGEAVKFIRAALKPERMAAQAQIWPYGPMRRSAARLARQHALLGTELDVFLPTSEFRFGQGIVFNAEYWAENGKRLEKRFDDWMSGVPLGIRVPPPRKAPPPPLPPPPLLRSAG